MTLLARLRCRVHGHYYHGDTLAKTYLQNTDGSTYHAGYKVHMRCLRCGLYEVRHLPRGVPRPRTDPVVSLRPDNEV